MQEQALGKDSRTETGLSASSSSAAERLTVASDLADKQNSSLISNTNQKYDHIVVVIEENHGFDGLNSGANSGLINDPDAPFINSLAKNGRLFTNAHAMTHPSQPNYLALFSGSTQGVRDDKKHSFNTSNLAVQLENSGLSFTGFAESPAVSKHNPWESFSNAQHLGADLSKFPGDFNKLPTVSFVSPNLDNDMHDGTVAEADKWLKDNLGSYADWAKTHNSLLIVMTDEDDHTQNNRIPVIVYGDGIKSSQNAQAINTIGVLHGIEKELGLPFLGDNSDAADLSKDQH